MALFEALPADLNKHIASALSENLGLSQLNLLRLVNKTWKGAVEGGLFGRLGRLLRPRLPKVALLFRDGALTPKYPYSESALPAMGIFDEATWQLHIVPLSTNSAPFDDTQTCAVLTGQSIFCFSDSRPQRMIRCETVQLSSFNLVSKKLKAYDPEENQIDEMVTWHNHLYIRNLTPLDEYRFVLFGYGFVLDSVGSRNVRLVKVFDSRSATWVTLPPLPDLFAERPLSVSQSVCYVSQGRIWVGHKHSLYSITSEADTTTGWRQEDVSALFQPLDVPPPSFEVLSSLEIQGGPLRYQLAILTWGRPQLLDVPAPRGDGVLQAMLGAVAVSGRLLLMSRERAFLDGKEVEYVWEQGAGVDWSSRKCRVLWHGLRGWRRGSRELSATHKERS